MPVSDGTEAPSIALLLDQARGLIIDAWDRGERPEYLLVHHSLYEAVLTAKAREHSFGRPVRLLGLLVVSSPGIEPRSPVVR